MIALLVCICCKTARQVAACVTLGHGKVLRGRGVATYVLRDQALCMWAVHNMLNVLDAVVAFTKFQALWDCARLVLRMPSLLLPLRRWKIAFAYQVIQDRAEAIVQRADQELIRLRTEARSAKAVRFPSAPRFQAVRPRKTAIENRAMADNFTISNIQSKGLKALMRKSVRE